MALKAVARRAPVVINVPLVLNSAAVDQTAFIADRAALSIVDTCEAQPELASLMNSEFPGRLAEETARVYRDILGIPEPQRDAAKAA